MTCHHVFPTYVANETTTIYICKHKAESRRLGIFIVHDQRRKDQKALGPNLACYRHHVQRVPAPFQIADSSPLARLQVDMPLQQHNQGAHEPRIQVRCTHAQKRVGIVALEVSTFATRRCVDLKRHVEKYANYSRKKTQACLRTNPTLVHPKATVDVVLLLCFA